MVEENTAAGEDVGAPVAAGDSDDDILTYTLRHWATADDGAFDIDQATGQIKTKADLDADTTGTPTRSQSRPRTRAERPTSSR